MKSLLVAGAVSLALGLALARAEEPKKDGPKLEIAASKQEAKAVNDNEVAVIKTTEGELVLQFWPGVAPKTVENFKTLAKKGFYDGTCFHRIIDGFMIQGGDPFTKDPSNEANWGTGDPGYKIKGETNRREDRRHVRGVISMANSGHPDTAGCQFFICLVPVPGLDGGYTTFGKVIKGDDVLTKLGKKPVKPNPYDPRLEKSRPLERVAVESIKIVPADQAK
jgi:peptidyl-prolyl cis-trans isomerase B (cyclophilin B)